MKQNFKIKITDYYYLILIIKYNNFIKFFIFYVLIKFIIVFSKNLH